MVRVNVELIDLAFQVAALVKVSNRILRVRMANYWPVTATSANWNVTYLECRTTFAPILTSFSRSIVTRDSVRPV